MKKVALFVAFFLTLGAAAHGGQENWAHVAVKIEKALLGSLKTYEKGDTGSAVEEVADVYFGIFEGEEANMEIAVRRFLSVKRARVLEKAFTDLRRAMHNKSSLKKVRKMVLALTDDVKGAARDLDQKGIGYDVGYK
jgi:hypothetical protein